MKTGPSEPRYRVSHASLREYFQPIYLRFSAWRQTEFFKFSFAALFVAVMYAINIFIEPSSPGPYLELFARFRRKGWDQWGNEDVEINSDTDVALRNGYVNDPMRLLESPKMYRGSKS